MRHTWCQRFPTGEIVETRGVIASAIALGALTAAATAGGAVASGVIQSKANTKAAKLQTESADKAGELRAQADRDALEFTKQQAAEDARRFETTQQSNYDQWAAGQRRIGGLGALVGLPAREIPAYRSSVPGGSPQGMPTTNADPKLQSAIAAYQQANPGNVAIEPLTAALKQQGFNVDRFKYGGGVLSNNELNVGGQKYKVLGGEGTAGAYWYTPGTDDSAPGLSSAAMPNSLASLYTTPVYGRAAAPLTPALSVRPYTSLRTLVGR